MCDVCPLAKHKRLSFPEYVKNTSKPFKIIHVNIWGPYFVKSLSQCHYFLTVADDYTRVTWTFLMKQKQEVAVLIPSFAAYVEN